MAADLQIDNDYHIDIFESELTAVIIHYGNIHLHRLVGITDDSELALVNVDICIFFKSQFKKIDLSIILSCKYLLNAVRTAFEIGLDYLVLDVSGDAVEEERLWL